MCVMCGVCVRRVCGVCAACVVCAVCAACVCGACVWYEPPLFPVAVCAGMAQSDYDVDAQLAEANAGRLLLGLDSEPLSANKLTSVAAELAISAAAVPGSAAKSVAAAEIVRGTELKQSSSHSAVVRLNHLALRCLRLHVQNHPSLHKQMALQG